MCRTSPLLFYSLFSLFFDLFFSLFLFLDIFWFLECFGMFFDLFLNFFSLLGTICGAISDSGKPWQIGTLPAPTPSSQGLKINEIEDHPFE